MEEGESLGSYLRRIREEKNLTVDNAAENLNLKKEHIEAMESDTILNFVPSAYARGFLRNYAEYLELDRYSVIDRFNNLHDAETPKIYVKDIGPLISVEYRPRRSRGVVTYVAFVLMALAIFAIIYSYQRYYRGRRGGIFSIGSREKPVSIESPKAEAGDEEKTAAGVESKYVLEVKFIMNTTIKPTVDGTDIYGKGKIIGAGKTETLSAQESLVLEVDEASNVEIFYNGKKIQDLGKGKTRITLNEQGLEYENLDQ